MDLNSISKSKHGKYALVQQKEKEGYFVNMNGETFNKILKYKEVPILISAVQIFVA